MNQSGLKTFAQDARNKLRQLLGARLDYVLTADTAELRQQAAQVSELRTALKIEGRDPLIERVAYTWFNRLAALRFMDANGYHTFGARVITPATANETLPELLQQARAGALDADFKSQIANLKTFDDLLAGRIPVDHPEAQVFKLLLVAACNYYHRLMPFLFEKIGDATELLLPEDLLTEHSIVADFRENLTDEDCRNEEVLGWFYQYYISEKKDEVMARNAAVPKQDIPAVTQLFTPHWIVRYLVENSLGRLWLLNRPQSKLREKMPYYIEGEAENDFLRITKPEDIRLLDPAGGSGHMLTYAFELLYAMYEEEGYDAPQIPGLILRHNLYGVDICDRAVALAAFALCMKARAKDNRFFRRAVQPHLISLREIRFEESELREYIRALNLGDLFNQPMLKLLHQFEEAKNFGSLIQPCLDQAGIAFTRRAIEAKDLGGQLFLRETHAKVLRVLEQAEYLSQRYHVVVANPPYMGGAGMNSAVKEFATTHYDDSKGDLFAMFIKRGFSLSGGRAYIAMVTLQNWMFLSSFEQLRAKVLRDCTLITLTQIGFNSFPEMNSKAAQACAFVVKNAQEAQVGYYVNLNDAPQSSNKELVFLEKIQRREFFTASASDFQQIPGAPLAYWAPDSVRAVYGAATLLSDFAMPQAGLATGDNPRFQRSWYEIVFARIGFSAASADETKLLSFKWYPCNSGGPFRKWFGNGETVVNWERDGAEIRSFFGKNGRLASRPQNTQYYFKVGVTWTKIGSGPFAARFSPGGFIFDDTGRSAFPNDGAEVWFLLALMCSSAANYFLSLLNPTMSFTSGDIARLPAMKPTDFKPEIPKAAFALAKTDWDNFETSWDFRDLPLLRSGLKGATLAASWQNWKARCDAAIRRMQELEMENNRLFITAYGLQNELAPEVPEDQITLARADARKDMAAFLSYAVGCMFGRYSLDQPGLILADAGATAQDYLARIPQTTFALDADGILPVLDGEWFQDDIVGRFREFLRVTYGEENSTENLAFIEASLGKLDAKTGKAKPTDLRTYFVRDFYKEHLKTYKKRPIYWMFSSPEGSFQALIYLHRYTRDTVNLLLNDYVREFIGKLEEKHRQLTAVTLNESARPGDRTKAAKELGKLGKMLKEIRTWERDVLLPLAQQRIELDLDDGVKVNYLKFKGALVPIPGLEKQEE
jgi:Eco57I restriction-modification methylase